MTTERIYRFRSTNSLLGEHSELGTLTLYFAKPEELNDPMEGFHHFYWQGDDIVWTNFFRHYVYSLYSLSLLLKLGGYLLKLEEDTIPFDGSISDLPSQDLIDTFNDICRKVFEGTGLSEFISSVSSREYSLSQEETLFCLEQLMSVTIMEIGRTLRTDEPVSNGESYQVIAAAQLPVAHMMARSQFRQIEQYQRRTALDARRVSIDSVLRTSQARLKQSLDRRDLLKDRIHQNTPLILDFPRVYLDFMKRKAYPEWYTACFMRNYTNSSVWAHYGDHHRGVCLIFDVPVDDNGQSYLALTNSRHPGGLPIAFQDISYGGQAKDIDFFQSLSFRLTDQLLADMWFKDADGNLSSFHHESKAPDELDSEFAEYGSNFFHNVTIKTRDWEYEEELRLVLSDWRTPFSETKDRIFSYDFENLHGVIFGIDTLDSDKAEIIDIVRQKCHDLGRTDFQLYQAYYSPEDGNIQTHEMDSQILGISERQTAE